MAFVRRETIPEKANSPMAPQVDIYYEAQTDHCTKGKNFVVLSGTNSQTWAYNDLIAKMRSLGFCTLTFDWRSHGRSEDTPGDISSELFMLDASAIIRKVFGNEKVHIFSWSLGGFVGYQLAIFKPEQVASLIVYGSTSCWSEIAEGTSECIDSVNMVKRIFSKGTLMRLIGLANEKPLVSSALNVKVPANGHFPFLDLYFNTVRMEQKVKGPNVWLQVQGSKTFGQLNKIQCPVLQITVEHEGLATGATLHTMQVEAKRIKKAEPPVMLKDASGAGYSHFAMWEEGGLELMFGHIQAFYGKYA
jgi:pimeloyl-ACP methyl ester carboxylesterase